MTQHRVLALVPARKGSKRVPGKNSRSLGGKPLIEWTLEAAYRAAQIDRVLLSTDDADLLRYGSASQTEVIERPAFLASDTASTVDVALHALDQELEAGRTWDILCLLQPTSPFRPRGRIDEGISLLFNRMDAPAVVGVAEARPHPFQCFLSASNGALLPAAGTETQRSARTQDLPPAYALTGSFYAIRCDILRSIRGFVPAGTLGLICDASGEALDIDTEADFAAAQLFADTSEFGG